jgi:hypothetical protein
MKFFYLFSDGWFLLDKDKIDVIFGNFFRSIQNILTMKKGETNEI